MKCSLRKSNQIRQAAGNQHQRLSRAGWLTLALAVVGVLAASGCGVTGANTGQLTPLSASVNFGNVTTGSNTTHNVTVTNKGLSAIIISKVSVTGTGFSVAGITLPMTVPPGQSAVIPVLFTPASAGSATGTLAITSNAGGAPLTISLNGSGVTAPTPQITVSPASINFGNLTVGSSMSQTVTIGNKGSANLIVTQVSVQGSGFTVSGLALPTTLAPGQQATFTVTFTANAPGSVTGQVTVASNAAPAGLGLTATAVALTASISVNPSSIAFGNVDVGSSATSAVTITNSGNATLTIAQANMSGSGFATMGLAVPLSVNAGQTSNFTVKFTPAAAGNATGSLSLVSNAANSPTVTMGLSGTGLMAAAGINLNPSSIAFGNVNVGGSATSTVTVTNSGNATLTITQANATGSGFSSSGWTLPVSINAGQSSSFTAKFMPTAAGAVTGSITLLSNASPATVTLSGTGVTSAPGISVSPTSIPFGNVNVGGSSTSTVTVTNTGNATLTITQANATGSGFSASGWTLPVSINAGQSSSFTAKFMPTAAGAVTGSVSLASNAGPATITLSGTGVATAPGIGVSPTSIPFGNVNVGGSSTSTVTVNNTGNATLTVTQLNTTGSGFSTSGWTLPVSINAGQSSSFTAKFMPTAAGAVTGSISLTSSAGPASVTLSGTGVTSAPGVSVSPSSVAFGSVTLGTNSSQTVTITNTGNATLNVSLASVTGTGFSTTGLTPPFSINAGQSQSFQAQFAPASAGSATGSISLTTNAGAVTIPLSGTGVAVVSHSVTVGWDASASTISGYNVYRATVSGGPYTLLTTSLVGGLTFTDNTVQAGQTYFYVATAVDANGIESVFSNEVTVTIPTP